MSWLPVKKSTGAFLLAGAGTARRDGPLRPIFFIRQSGVFSVERTMFLGILMGIFMGICMSSIDWIAPNGSKNLVPFQSICSIYRHANSSRWLIIMGILACWRGINLSKPFVLFWELASLNHGNSHGKLHPKNDWNDEWSTLIPLVYQRNHIWYIQI